MNILVQLSHPAHFHYYHYSILNWMKSGNKVMVVIKSKDILEQLLIDAQIPYININEQVHRKNKLGIAWDMFIRDYKIWRICKREHIDLLTGSSAEVAHIGWLLHLPVVCTGEDDAAAIPAYEMFTSPFLNKNRIRLCPVSCNSGKMENYSIHYPSYHELAYLHPNHFTPSKDVVKGYGIEVDKPYFIFRFASLKAHHDGGIKGINTEIAQRLIDILSPHGRIYITSERELEPQFEPYRIHINPLDMHHVMAFASLYIGDSQTMAAEAAVLGVPFIRYNDFVGRIGYLRELEDTYHLGYGIRATKSNDALLSALPTGKKALYDRVEQLAETDAENRKHTFHERRMQMLNDKIDYAKFLTWFVENYPACQEETKNADQAFWNRFK